jgi:hypothetical protein
MRGGWCTYSSECMDARRVVHLLDSSECMDARRVVHLFDVIRKIGHR